MVTRYRSADRTQRQQLKWFVLALSLSALALGIVSAPAIVSDHPVDEVGLAVFAFAGAFVPLAIGIAILRHHLYDIDRLVSRTVAYGLISGILVVAYGATILLLHLPLGAVTDGDTVPVALSTLVVAALFQPVRTRIQRVVDRRFDRGHYDAERTVRRFGERLRNEVDIAAVTSDLARTTEITVAPANLAIWLRSEGGGPMTGVASSATRPTEPRRPTRPRPSNRSARLVWAITLAGLVVIGSGDLDDGPRGRCGWIDRCRARRRLAERQPHRVPALRGDHRRAGSPATSSAGS